MTDKRPSMVDWEFARQTANRFVRPGPEIPADEIAAAVAELREGAQTSEQPVRDYTGLHARAASAPVLVVDRPAWITANTEGFASILELLEAKIAESGKYPKGASRSIGSKVAGAEVGALLAFMSSKVLGQFDPFWAGGAGDTGRMLLVAPNIVTVEHELGVDPHDFRLWVCLHEETHRVQFTAVPWLRDHVQGLIGTFVESTEVDPSGVSRLLSDGATELGRVLRGEPDSSIVDVLQNPQQREVVDQMTGVMSLLEGHADVVMDGVGPEVIPSVRTIRKRFNHRRKGKGGLDSLLRRLLGLDAKMRQYRDGATFVRTVVDKVGHEGFNAVWAEPANLPSKLEIGEPSHWLARVHG
ncbi:zinc-dependent metalloprotease [Solicola gregarius]|uniref:Zinc-dependent metalloprotease n=1 Tax=Solicola gregarius TaxID=2908642 RepID=A0AA46TKZ9_9ACTN|nr:zinc-dependent metalloprotease [Solicola gregarius]UYM07010.1 zinc-dependent metalloprotease [Solicola gregarius]